ncbi:MAG: hypothetical protein RR645_04300, partial [Clostridium sp.]
IALHTTIVPKGRVQSISLIKNVLSSKKDMVRLRVSIQDTYFATIKTLRGIKIDIANKIIDEYK